MALDDTVDPTTSLLNLLNLSPADGAQTDEDIFVGGSQPEPQKRIFGGQVLGQSLVAAAKTVEPGRLMHSMHAYFLRPGDTEVPITFGVQRLRDGRSFSARRTHAYQNGVPILSMIASFQVPGEGLDHQVQMPDGIPDPDEYLTKVGGEEMSMVRLLVGKSNQNKEANLAFAKQIKAVGDKVYPGLIKDIYMGKGTYNQDLAPRSVLLEFGTHTLPKERVEASTGPMAEVVYKTLFGGVIGSAGGSDASSSKQTEEVKPATESNEGSGAAIWIILALVIGLGVFAFLSAGKNGGMDKWKHSLSEMTGGLIGKKPKGRQ